MKPIKIESLIHVCANETELDPADQALMKAAKEAATHAYAPYSEFHVGAAVRLENGSIEIGNNQENAAFPSGLCAERVALFSANARYPDQRVVTLAITAYTAKYELDFPVAPCGACRQVILETEERYGGEGMRILLQGTSGEVWILDSIKSILPLSFGRQFLLKR